MAGYTCIFRGFTLGENTGILCSNVSGRRQEAEGAATYTGAPHYSHAPSPWQFCEHLRPHDSPDCPGNRGDRGHLPVQTHGREGEWGVTGAYTCTNT